jgi:nitrile hydratase
MAAEGTGEAAGHHHHHDAAPDVDDRRLGYYEAMCWALRDLLSEKGLLSRADVHAALEAMESKGAHLGARVVARAWQDPAFRRRLLADGKAACAELSIPLTEAQLVVVENTATVHNVIVCTLCSCYPRSLLGQPPSWYISRHYRARTVREPRAVLAEFGLVLPADVAVRVHDSTADMRYLVLPERPPGTDSMDEAALAALVTRGSLIGTEVPLTPASR